MKIWYGLFGLVLAFVHCADENRSALIHVGEDGKLVAHADSLGNTIPDFSRAGYMGGGVALPHVPDVIILQPADPLQDDTGRIQAAIDSVSRRSLSQGFRGAVLLRKGTYAVSGSLRLGASGVVLRGEGQGPDGTIINATGTEKRTLIHLGGVLKITEIAGSRQKIAAAYVPWGTMSFAVENGTALHKGDKIIIYRPSTIEWIRDLKMDRIVEREGTKQWQPGSKDLIYERTIMAVHGNRVELDAPVINAMEEKYGGGYIYRYEEEGRINQSGLENLRLVSSYVKGKEDEDEEHAWTGVTVDDAANAWVRNISIVHFARGVDLYDGAIFITVQDCALLKPVSQIRGSRRYPFPVKGQYCLVQRCYSDHARHMAATGACTCGPNVFLDMLAEKPYNDTGPHQRWAAGILFDNLKGGRFHAQDRGNWGTGHGWAGAQQIFWNCETDSICVQKPPTGQNYAIGCTGKLTRGRFPDREPGYVESHGRHVTPRSLYLQQLQDRLGEQAVENVTTAAQRQGTVYDQLQQALNH